MIVMVDDWNYILTICPPACSVVLRLQARSCLGPAASMMKPAKGGPRKAPAPRMHVNTP